MSELQLQSSGTYLFYNRNYYSYAPDSMDFKLLRQKIIFGVAYAAHTLEMGDYGGCPRNPPSRSQNEAL
ncbi:MAG: hypothetical protein CVV49_19010 [Spirochaetae bacterium HGW-Spirochaetae-5]|nr:MAG: hypothetical protein CVV49_19010 [Spirochaetae bacterium HGW-Spirochaetae-5]